MMMMLFRVFLSMMGAFFVKSTVNIFLPAELLREDIHGIASFLEVTGALYGIVLAFIIFVVWDQYNRCQTGIFLEAAALEDLCHTASLISDSESFHKLKALIIEYLQITANDEASYLSRGEFCSLSGNAFLQLTDAVRDMNIKNSKDQVVYGELFNAMSRVNSVRDARLGVSGSRIPSTLWNLILFYSVSIMVGFLFVGIRIPFLGSSVVAVVTGGITFLLFVICDLDNPFEGVWVVSYAPIVGVKERLKMLRERS
ncbi:MAG: DUF4239 domain-containing protein [Candidatus Riflebacteria bacterium]|nr:DUF4239 domain-containing protein [Candidatus Riflebacteria bacterium]